MESGLVLNIQRYSLRDGPGIRTTVFLKGCPLDCWWCHNPESQEVGAEVLLADGRCIRCGQCKDACPHGLDGVCARCGACVEACPTEARQLAGRRMTVAETMAEIRKDRMFHEDSRGGVTFSGGEPLMQFAFVYEMLGACRAEGIHAALDTCGFSPPQQFLAAAAKADLVLFDLKLIDAERHLQYTGVSNERILKNLAELGRIHENIWIRIPIIPGVNDDDADLAAAAEIARHTPGVRQVCLLPYHRTGTHKLRRLGRPMRLDGVVPPTSQRMQQIADRFQQLGLHATIGG